jgi:hypothetical protein
MCVSSLDSSSMNDSRRSPQANGEDAMIAHWPDAREHTRTAEYWSRASDLELVEWWRSLDDGLERIASCRVIKGPADVVGLEIELRSQLRCALRAVRSRIGGMIPPVSVPVLTAYLDGTLDPEQSETVLQLVLRNREWEDTYWRLRSAA